MFPNTIPYISIKLLLTHAYWLLGNGSHFLAPSSTQMRVNENFEIIYI